MLRNRFVGLTCALVAAILTVGLARPLVAGETPPPPKEGEEAPPALTPEQQAGLDMLGRYKIEREVAQSQRRFLSKQHYEAGKNSFDMGYFRPALRHFEKSIELDPNNKDTQAYLQKTRSMLNVQERRPGDLAREYADQKKIAIEVQLTELKNLMVQAKEHFAREHYEEAIEAFTRAAGKARYLSPSVDVGNTAIQAEEYIQRALRGIEDRNARRAAERRKNAEEETTRLRDEREKMLDERTLALYRQAVILFDQRRYEEARKTCDEILLKDPNNGPAATLRESAVNVGHDEQVQRAIKARRVETERHWDETRAMTVPQAELVYMPRDKFEEVRNRETSTSIGGELKPPEPWESQIREKMDKKISFDFVETPLQDVISFISSLVDVTIVLDQEAIRDEAPTVTLRVNEMRLESALNWVLKLVGLRYTLKNEAVFVSKPDRIYDKPVLRMYDVTDLTIDIKNFQGRQQALASDGGYSSTGSAGAGGGESSIGEDFFGDEDEQEEEDRLTGETLVEFIKKTIAPGSWVEDGIGEPF